MKAVGLYKYLPIENPESLIDVEVPTPQPHGHDLLVRVKAVSVNPVDAKVRAPKDKVESEPKILGWDAAGGVEAAGEQASLFSPGDEVYYAGSLSRQGCDSEYHLVDERIVGRKPRNLSFEEAAAMPLTILTAWEALFDRMGAPRSGSSREASFLVIAGAGGVGSIAIQIAKQVAGLRVIASASRSETEAWCYEMGADAVINHRQPLKGELQRIGAGEADYILCAAGTEAYFPRLPDVLAPQGKVCFIVGTKDPVNLNVFQGKSATICLELMFTRAMFHTADMQAQHDILEEAARLLEDSTLRHTMQEHYGPLNAENLRRAHATIESGRMIGKLVLSGIG
ncbi:MAG TPA: zinc-binding alcohol dehydrogenase family protein [Thermoanaerobaculia bacterium]|jgi:zinc-binding alcohol dehydrogenase family protein|nr:zinc-binding alcohol dehydrogenase family protein [Thermoanaerobaculia bacterium]